MDCGLSMFNVLMSKGRNRPGQACKSHFLLSVHYVKALFIYVHARKINIHFVIFLLVISSSSSSVEPKVYVSAGPTALLDGANESLVATCIAERGRPAAEVFWDTELYGRSEKQSHEEANGTSTTHVRYLWQPQSYAQGKKLTCVVRHPALQTEFRIPYTLNIQCESPLGSAVAFFPPQVAECCGSVSSLLH